jgi:hypothetical protein
VMRIDMQITGRVQFNIDHAVPRDLIDHVIEKWNAGIEFGDAFSIKINDDADLGFFGVAGDVSGSHNF